MTPTCFRRDPGLRSLRCSSLLDGPEEVRSGWARRSDSYAVMDEVTMFGRIFRERMCLSRVRQGKMDVSLRWWLDREGKHSIGLRLSFRTLSEQTIDSFYILYFVTSCEPIPLFPLQATPQSSHRRISPVM